MTTCVSLAHLSDIHVTAAPLGWRPRDWCSKRLTGWFNTHCSSRRWRFRQAATILAVLVAELRDQHRPDCVVFSGDASMLGFSAELTRAAAVLEVDNPAMPPGFTVPGNHDYYTPAAEATGVFERCFRPWLDGDRVDEHIYPFARRVGPLWLVGVSACAGRFWPWDATGCVSADQLQRLDQLLKKLDGGPRILVTHYPVSDRHGRPERPWHLLRNLADLVTTAERGGIGLWLHGHRHDAYHIDDARVAPFPVICAGSATESGIAGYNAYAIDGLRLHAVRRRFDSRRNAFQDAEQFDVRMRG